MSHPIETFPSPWMDHRVSRLWGVDNKLSDNVDALVESSYKVLTALNLKDFDLMKKQFKPQGITVVWGLETSHIAIHTWPEDIYRFMHFDALTCGGPESSLEDLHRVLEDTYSPRSIITEKVTYTNPQTVIRLSRAFKLENGVQDNLG